jgi:hypothetical protein
MIAELLFVATIVAGEQEKIIKDDRYVCRSHLPPMLRAETILVRLAALWLSHIKNHDLDSMLLMVNTGVYSSWALPMTIIGVSKDSFVLLMHMCSLDMATGVMHGITISVRTGTNV